MVRKARCSYSSGPPIGDRDRKTQLVELQSRYAEITKQGLGLIAISYDAADTQKKFADSRGITFPLISDTGSAIIKRYGLLNVPGWGMP